MTDAIDLSALMPTETAVLDVLKPGGTESSGWKVTFAGPGHEKTIAWQNEQSKKALRKQSQIEAAQANGRKIKAEERDPEQVRRDNAGWVVSRIVDWNPIRVNGSAIEFTPEAAMELLLDRNWQWAFTQMVDFLADDRSFAKPLS